MANGLKGGLSDDDIRFVIEHGKLNKVEIFVLITRVMGWTVKQQSNATTYSERQIARYISNVQKVYDELQSKHERDLPLRPIESETDRYLNEH